MFLKRSPSPSDWKVKKKEFHSLCPFVFETFFHLIRNKNKWLYTFRINFWGVLCVCPWWTWAVLHLQSLSVCRAEASSQLFVKCVSVCLLLFVAASVCLYCLQESICWPPARPSSLASDNQHPLASPLLLLLFAGKASCPPLTLLLHHWWAEEAAQKTWPEHILTVTIISFKKLQLK